MENILTTNNVAELHKVRDINWADPKINRAGVIPIYDDGKYKWIGLGVTTFSANIISIGGSYEKIDKDLLDTAVREYNEEVGQNLKNIVDESLFNCYAIKTSYTIQVLLPIPSRPYSFKKTNELHTMIWVTTKQLQAMYNASEILLPGPGKARAFKFSRDLIKVINPLIESIDDGTPFQLVNSSDPFVRPHRVQEIISASIVTDINEFREDIKGAKGVISLMVTDNNIGIYGPNKNIYMLDIKDADIVSEILNTSDVLLITSNNYELRNIRRVLKLPSRRIDSIELYSEDLYKSVVDEFKTEYNLNKEKGLDNDKYLATQLKLILVYEDKLYSIVLEKNSYFNAKRACFLEAFNSANNSLTLGPMPLLLLKRNIGNVFYIDKGSKFTVNVIGMISFWIKNGIFLQNPVTTEIYIPL